MPQNKKYWEFKNQSNNEADLYLYIQIASWGGGYSAHSAQSFKQELDDLGDISTLNVYVNSPGGDVFEGAAIFNILNRKKKKCQVNVYVDGLAASIASVIAMAGSKIIMPSNSMMMIHNPWCYTGGNAIELRKTADDLDKVSISIRQAYLDRAGDKLDEDTLKTLLDNETWLTAQECYDYGLCDEVGDEKNIEASINDEIFSHYKNIPKSFIKDEREIKEEQNIDEIANKVIKTIEDKKKTDEEEIKNKLEEEKRDILEDLDLI